MGNNNSIIVIGIYRPPSAPPEALDKLAELIMPLIDHTMIIPGDLNYDWLTSASDNLKELFYNLNFTQFNSHPTCPNPKDFSKSSLIDLTLTNKPKNYLACGGLDLGISDHCPIVCIRDVKLKKAKSHLVV